MWKNLWTLVELVTNSSQQITRLEKDLEVLEKDHREQGKEIQAIWVQLGRLIERENWREEKLRHELEVERLNAEAARAKAEAARLRQELERQQRRLPPSSSDRADTED